MKKIALVIPYFGKMRKDIRFWMHSCSYNKDIDWMIFTDDKETLLNESIPSNIKIIYMTFDEMKNRVQDNYNFEISLEKPYKLCDYKPAYGEIFKNELVGYDIWGHCDMDLLFGKISDYINEDMLDKYERIGRWGHLILYKNSTDNNSRYRTVVDGIKNYKDVFTNNENCFFDENAVLYIYRALGISIYEELDIADINPAWWRLEIFTKDKIEKLKNKNRIFLWEDGKLISYSLNGNQIITDEFMYVHFLRRPMKILNIDLPVNKLLIIPNEIQNLNKIDIIERMIRSSSKNKMLKYWILFIKRKWREITLVKVKKYINVRV